MRSKGMLEIEFADEKSAKSALLALKQEEDFRKRVSSSVSVKGKMLFIKIDANDVVAFRATMNSYLRNVQIMEQLEENDE